MHGDGRHRGLLAIECSEDSGPEGAARAEALLAVAAPTAAVCAALEAVRGEQAELGRFALVGQAFLGLAHDLNNALNGMMLQTSVVQLRVDEPLRQDLAAIRQQGAQAAALVRSLQHVVQERREQSYPVDLNAVVAEVLAEGPGAAPHLSPQPPTVHTTRSALKQLVRLLLEGAGAATRSPVRVRTEKPGEGAALIVETGEAPPGVGDDPASGEEAFWSNLDEVSRHAGRSLLRQLGGTLEVRSTAEGTMVLYVRWDGSVS
jgi:signal transduction histidine kinase